MADTVWDLSKAIKGSPAGTRARSDSDPGVQNADAKALDIATPGGFRRHHVKNKDMKVSPHLRNQILQRVSNVYDPFISSMLSQDNDKYDEFDLAEKVQMLLHTPGVRDALPTTSYQADEQVSLLTRKRTASMIESGKTTTLYHALLALLKSFVGTGVLFLPQGFENGGIIFSPIVLAFIAVLTLYAMLRLLQCRQLVGGTYGYIGEAAYGVWGHRMVQISIVFMQIGFCCTYIIFVAQNMQDVFAYFNVYFSLTFLIVVQFVIYIPLSWIRYISYFAISNLIADAFILYGVLYIMGNSVSVLATEGIQPLVYFNSNDYAVFIGTAVFTFEGIGLIIPTQSSLNKERQQKFEPLLISTMIGLFIFYTAFASINYLAFGSGTNPLITTNLPRNNWAISVQFGYSIAQLLSYPLFLFPAVKIVEDMLLLPRRASGYKVQKNIIRSMIVLSTVSIAYFGQNRLDLFVSIVGAFCCVPLSFIYPPLFYLKLASNIHWVSKAMDCIVILIGLLIFVYVTYSNLQKWKMNSF